MNKSTCFIFLILILLSTSACLEQDDIPTLFKTPVMSAASVACPEHKPTVMPKPKFLKWLHPADSLTKQEYNASLSKSDFRGIQISVLAYGLDASVLKSKDNDYRRNAISDRISLSVDGLFVPNNPSTIFDGLVDEGPFGFSWPIPLGLGYHQVKLVFNTDTKETLHYEWAFCILP